MAAVSLTVNKYHRAHGLNRRIDDAAQAGLRVNRSARTSAGEMTLHWCPSQAAPPSLGVRSRRTAARPPPSVLPHGRNAAAPSPRREEVERTLRAVKVFPIDVLECPHCAGRLQLVAFIADGGVAKEPRQQAGAARPCAASTHRATLGAGVAAC